MAIPERIYYSDGRGQTCSTGFDISPVVKWLIIINVVVFVLQTVITRPYNRSDVEAHIYGSQTSAKADKAKKDAEINEALRELEGVKVSPVTEWLALDPDTTLKQGQLWRLVTSAFCHSRTNIMHIVFNMLFLYWFGTRVERMYGSREFLLFYFAAELCSSFAFLGLAYLTNSHIGAIGASGAVMGVMMLYTCHFPYERWLLMCFIPVPLWLLTSLYVVYDLHPILRELAGEKVTTGVAHAGHLGGLAFGFVYWYTGTRLDFMAGMQRRKLGARTTVARRLELD